MSERRRTTKTDKPTRRRTRHVFPRTIVSKLLASGSREMLTENVETETDQQYRSVLNTSVVVCCYENTKRYFRIASAYYEYNTTSTTRCQRFYSVRVYSHDTSCGTCREKVNVR